MLERDSFFGETCLAGQTGLVTKTATAVEDSTLVRIDKPGDVNAPPQRAHLFRAVPDPSPVSQTIRIQEDLVDHLFNSSEKRLARVLLLLAHFGKEGKPEAVIHEDQPGNARRDDRHHALPRQFLHE